MSQTSDDDLQQLKGQLEALRVRYIKMHDPEGIILIHIEHIQGIIEKLLVPNDTAAD